MKKLLMLFGSMAVLLSSAAVNAQTQCALDPDKRPYRFQDRVFDSGDTDNCAAAEACQQFLADHGLLDNVCASVDTPFMILLHVTKEPCLPGDEKCQ